MRNVGRSHSHCRWAVNGSERWHIAISTPEPMDSKHTAQAAEVLAAYEKYLEAFMSNDMNGINALVSYPLAYVGDGVVKMFHEYPIKPSELMAQTGW
jgi:hypothetical protein